MYLTLFTKIKLEYEDFVDIFLGGVVEIPDIFFFVNGT